MLDKKRITEAEKNVKSYLAEGLLKKTTENKKLIELFVKDARESLKVADKISKENISELWTIVCSYYSMYYYANAVLLKLSYKVGDKIAHKVTSDALIVYVRKKLKDSLIEEYEETKEEALNLAGIKADSIIESFGFFKKKKKKTKAQTSLNLAKEFAIEMDKLLIN